MLNKHVSCTNDTLVIILFELTLFCKIMTRRSSLVLMFTIFISSGSPVLWLHCLFVITLALQPQALAISDYKYFE